MLSKKEQVICVFFYLSFVTGSTSLGLPHCQSIIEEEETCMKSDEVYNVSIDINGTDIPECVNDTDPTPCRSLQYALHEIELLPISNSSTTWLILISSNQFLASQLQISFNTSISCLILCGTKGEASGQATISSNSSVNSPIINLKTNRNAVSLIISNLAFDFGLNIHNISKKSLVVGGFTHFIVSNVLVTKSADWRIHDISNFSIIDSTLYDNYYTKGLLYTTVTSAYLNNVNITTTHAKAVSSAVDSLPAGPVHIKLEGQKSMALVEHCTFYYSGVSKDTSLKILASGIAIYASRNDSEISIRDSEFGFTQFLFYSWIAIESQSAKIVLSGLSMHDNQHGVLDSLIRMVVLPQGDRFRFPIVVKNSSFFRNSGVALNFHCRSCRLNLTDCTFRHSRGQVLVAKYGEISLINVNVFMMTNRLFSEVALFDLESMFVTFGGNVSISNNIGTPLAVSYSVIHFNEGAVVQLVNNSGQYGGGMKLNEYTSFSAHSSARLSLESNSAIFGGAMYISIDFDNDTTCAKLLQCLGKSFENLNATFQNNTAVTKGNQILFDFGSHQPRDFENCNENDLYTAMFSSLTFKKEKNLVIFPGQEIQFQVSANEICEATLYLTCGPNSEINSCPSEMISLSGSSKVIIPQGNNAVTTNLNIKTDINVTHIDAKTDLNLHVLCSWVRTTVSLSIRNCTLGFTFNATDKSCQGCNDCDPTLYQYSIKDGVACIRRDHWYGTDGNGSVIIERCYFPFCDYYSGECPVKSEQPFMYHALPENQDDQCSYNKGKILCRQCKDGYHFTYLGIQCVEGSGCGWNLLGLILLAIILNIIVGLLWIAIVRFKGGLTFGISLGPIIFIAFGRTMSFGAVKSLEAIQGLFSILSLVIFDNSVLGYIPACTPITTGVGQQALNYIGPFVVSIMILIVAITTNCCPRYSNKILQNPIQTICLLALVTFWSLARTSVTLLLPIKIGGSYRFSIDPNIPIYSYYVFVWFISIPVLILVIGVIIFMAVSPFLSRRFNTIRIKPILDVFHSPYKDKWRWYSSVYFATWVITSVLLPYPSANIYGLFVFLIISVVHFIYQPYNLNWLNIVDTLLLVDIIIMYNGVQYQVNNAITVDSSIPVTTVMVYSLSLLPPLWYVLVFTILLMAKVNRIHHAYMNIKQHLRKPSLSRATTRDDYCNILTVSEEHKLARKGVTRQDLHFVENSEIQPTYRDSILNM